MLNQLCYLYNLRIYKCIPFEFGSVSLKIPVKKVTNHSNEWILVGFCFRKIFFMVKALQNFIKWHLSESLSKYLHRNCLKKNW